MLLLAPLITSWKIKLRLTPSNQSYFNTYPIRPSFYLYFNPQLILSATVLFPESQIMVMMITFIGSLNVGYGLGQRNALCLSFESISLFWNDFPMDWDLGASLKKFLKHWPWHNVPCVLFGIWWEVQVLLIFSWSVICSIMAYCVSLGSMTRTLEKRARVPPPPNF